MTKQNGKSRTLSAKYTPTADHPYSLDSFLNRPLSDRFSSLAPCAALRLHAEKKKLRLCVAPLAKKLSAVLAPCRVTPLRQDRIACNVVIHDVLLLAVV
ncbi:hypothetical protein MKX07_000680 [Trichoderma sp. CBMAI-0711]|nr:hypothetical protein MKX07_000680 [Trichoderma sp. CBMAI-0711]